MLQSQFVRYLSRSVPSWSASQKSQLAKLRKKTGYTFANCKKALEISNNDLPKAEQWLQDQAEALGWSKLAKMEGRTTAQGLVGIAFQERQAAMVEVSCETDFVSRNKHFKEMVDMASKSCLRCVKEPTSSEISKMWLDAEQLKAVESVDGKLLSNHVALLVSSVGENVLMKRAVTVGVSKELNVSCYVHPAPDTDDGIHPINGRYGAILMYSAPKYNTTTQQLARQLCQHIVGMNPKTVYKSNDEIKETVAKSDGKKAQTAEPTPSAEREPGAEDESEQELSKEENNETAMMAQDFLLDPTMTVEQVLDGSGILIHDFVRFQAGERIETPHHVEDNVKAMQVGG